jgi:HTH-type transcriptional regulator/antitoxin HigA
VGGCQTALNPQRLTPCFTFREFRLTFGDGGGFMAIKMKSKRQSEPDAYMALVRRFPLKAIKDDPEHERAVAIIGELLGHKLDSGASDYLDTLILLVNKHEDENHAPKGVHLSPREALRAIMAANDMSQAEMGRIIGSESAVSMFLKGQRDLSKSHIKALAARFRVDAGLFL